MAYKEVAVTTLPSTGWKLPLNLAILLHILILSAVIILPKYIQQKEISPEVFTVDLVSITEPAADSAPPPVTSEPPPAQAEQPVVTIQKLQAVESRKTAPIAQSLVEEVTVEPAKIISLKPLKRKVINKDAPELHAKQIQEKLNTERKKKQRAAEAREQQRQRTLEAQRQQLLLEAQRQQALAAAEAQAAANEAVNALKHSLQANAIANSAATTGRASSRPSAKTSSVLASQYHASIFAHLHKYWALPAIKPWDANLTAVVIIRISKNGKIISHRFEKRSGDRVFDQFVNKTIEDANPLPAIPGALKKNEYTLGLRFKPGGIH